MISAQDPRLRGLGPGHCIVFLGTQEYKWVQQIVREA